MNNKKNDISIVTAFFPLKREDWSGFERPNNKYFEYFEFWARIKNDMVIYTDKESSKYVKDIRINKYKRKNTKIVVIDDWKKIDTEIYEKINSTTKDELSINYKINPSFPESWNGDYNYMTNLKSWFVQDAVDRKIVEGMIAWIDFGFNHSGDYYIDSLDFDFKWEYDFKDKITIFSINDLDELPIFEICRRMNSYIQGNVMVAPDYLWKEFWDLVRKSIIELANIGLSDDDQTITLMAYRKSRERFEVLKTHSWFSMLEQYGNKKFKTRNIKVKKFEKIRKIKQLLLHRKNIRKYLKFWYNTLKNELMKG